MIHKCKLRNHTGSRDVLVFQWDLEHTVQSALKALQASERFVVCKFRHLCGQKEKMIRFVKLNLKEMSVNETDEMKQITLYVCGLKHAFVSHQLQTI